MCSAFRAPTGIVTIAVVSVVFVVLCSTLVDSRPRWSQRDNNLANFAPLNFDYDYPDVFESQGPRSRRWAVAASDVQTSRCPPGWRRDYSGACVPEKDGDDIYG